MCVLSLIYSYVAVCTVQCVVSLLFVSLCYFLITGLCCSVFLLCLFLFCTFVSHLYILCFFNSFVYCLSFCIQLSVSLLLLHSLPTTSTGGHPTAVNKHIISCHVITTVVLSVTKPISAHCHCSTVCTHYRKNGITVRGSRTMTCIGYGAGNKHRISCNSVVEDTEGT